MDQPLTLQCEVITVRGITSRLDIVWSSDGTEHNVPSTIMGKSLVYTDKYTISQLSTADDDRVIQCEVVFDVNPPVMANDSITLDVTGECHSTSIVCDLLLLYTQFPLLQSPYHHLVPYKEL